MDTVPLAQTKAGVNVAAAGGLQRFAPWMVRLVAAWLLTGAFFKLFVGTPNDLPQVVRDLPLGIGLTYKLAISIELAVGFCALLKPRWAWIPLAGAMVVFDVILTMQLAAGEANCGCFGSKVSMPPWLMMVIDTALLIGLLATRPWAGMPRGLRAPFPIVAMALGIVLPWLFDREVTSSATADGQPVAGAYFDFRFDKKELWVEQLVFDTPLGRPPLSEHIDVNTFFPSGLWIFWRATCEHCAEHLSHLADTQMGQNNLVLIQLREKHDTEGNRVVHRMPSGNFVQHATLPESMDYVMTTPAEILIEDYVVKAVAEGVSAEENLLE